MYNKVVRKKQSIVVFNGDILVRKRRKNKWY